MIDIVADELQLDLHIPHELRAGSANEQVE
jgi:hypothetical protein